MQKKRWAKVARMKSKDDSRMVKQKNNDRKPVSFEAQKMCRKLGCFFCCGKEKEK
jgi:hypothetical protein